MEDVLRIALRRRDYLAHPVLLSGLFVSLAAARLTSGPMRQALIRLANEIKVRVCHERSAHGAPALLARYAPLRLHVGCGTRVLPGWCNVDLGPQADLRVDVRRGLPVRDASCVEIYSEHLVEHLAYPGEVEAVLRDWHRVLIPGGCLSVGVPDVAPALLDYPTLRDRFVADHSQPWCPVWIETALDQLNYLFRQQGVSFGQDHLYAYDLPTLAARLASAGFVDVRERPFDPERDSRTGTLHVDARKA